MNASSLAGRALTSGRPLRGTRLLGLIAMIAAVVLIHLWVGREFSLALESWREIEPVPAPMEVTVMDALKPAPPPRLKSRVAALSAAPPAAAAMESWSGAQPMTPDPVAEATAALNDLPALQLGPDGAKAAANEAAAASEDFWPPSTRVRYTLKGNYRGEFSGQAQVLWLREGLHYQVQLDVSIGPRSAPLISRRVLSDGQLGPAGLEPQRYQEETKVLFSRARKANLKFEPAVNGEPAFVVLPDGNRRPALPGTQDSASQFVQIAWMFATGAASMKPGDKLSFPLALPRRSDVWSFVVGEPMVISTPAGPVEAIHAKPQRELDPLRRDLLAEVWFAPSLRYLPVRIRVLADEDSYADLTMDGLPELIAEGFKR